MEQEGEGVPGEAWGGKKGGTKGEISAEKSPLSGPPANRRGPKGFPQKGYPRSGRFPQKSLRNYCRKCPKNEEI